MVEVFFLVEVLVRPSLERKKSILTWKVLTGNTDSLSIGGRVNDGIRVFLVKGINAYSVNSAGDIGSSVF